MKLYLIDPHDERLYKNNLFNTDLDPNFITIKKVREYLLKKGIRLDSIDLHPVEKADKIFFIDYNSFSLFGYRKSYYLQLCLNKKIVKKKMNLIIFECPVIKPENWVKKNHRYFSKIFTWNDAWVDNKKYFHFHWPQNKNGMRKKFISFKKKRFLTLINAHKTNYLPDELYSLRIAAIRYFEKTHPQDFDLYGVGWGRPLSLKFAYSSLKRGFNFFNFLKDYCQSLKGFPSYKGQVDDKYATLSQYKFALCFENMKNIDGYITEKIFDCFKAGCVPVYFGAKNITHYIPKQTFIDFRNFRNFDDLYNFLKIIREGEYNDYLKNIRNFLNSKSMNQWYYQSFCRNIFLK